MKKSWLSIFAAAFLGMGAAHAQHHRVVVVSIDGLRGSVLAELPDASRKLPNLTEIVEKGVVANGMVGVLPTNTYPSHTSMATGVSPNIHGILGNYLFDPERSQLPSESWYEYSDLIRAPTLWGVAHSNGLRTASVYWPVTQGAMIDANFPEVHHRFRGPYDWSFYGALCTPGLLSRFEKIYGKLPMGATVPDLVRTQMALFLIKDNDPDLLLVHLAELDGAEHNFGPESREAARALENIDSFLGMIRETLSASPRADETDLVVVSDHGFLEVEHALHPSAVLSSIGLAGTKEHPESYRVASFGSGGSFGLVARDGNDRDAIELATRTFERLLKEGSWGIDRLITADEASLLKGYSNSFLVVNMKSGYAAEDGDSGPWLTTPSEAGTHGYAPGPKELEASFAAIGPDIAHQRLERGHIVDVAPTVADLLGIPMHNTEGVRLLAKRHSAEAH